MADENKIRSSMHEVRYYLEGIEHAMEGAVNNAKMANILTNLIEVSEENELRTDAEIRVRRYAVKHELRAEEKVRDATKYARYIVNALMELEKHLANGRGIDIDINC